MRLTSGSVTAKLKSQAKSPALFVFGQPFAAHSICGVVLAACVPEQRQSARRLRPSPCRTVIRYHPSRKSDISRWGARTSNPVEPANAGSVGSTPTSSATHSIKTTSSILLLVLHTNLPTIKKSLDAPVVIGISARQPHRTLPTSQRSRHRVSSAPPPPNFHLGVPRSTCLPICSVKSRFWQSPPMRFGNA